MDNKFIEGLRRQELELAASFIPLGSRVLEVGAGAGWQTRMLADRGFDVEAIDVVHSRYASIQVWPVRSYNGHTIPFEDKTFDIVFTSSVLEHVTDVQVILREIKRVLKPGGLAIHVLPTPMWRFWTTFTHYPSLCQMVLRAPKSTIPSSNSNTARRQLIIHAIKQAIVPRRHGETGNALTELYHFSHHRWEKLFVRLGWTLKHFEPCGIFYSGNSLLGNVLPIRLRQRLARFLGSATTIYVLVTRNH